MDERVRSARQKAFGLLGVSLIALGPWVGWWPLLLLPPAAAFFAIADRLKTRVSRPEYPMFASFLAVQVTLAGAVALAGGARAPGISWLAIAVVVLSSRFSMRGVVAGVVFTILLVLAVAFSVDRQVVFSNPAVLLVPLTLVLCVAVLSTPLMRSDIQHRSDAVFDQLTGMLNRHSLQSRALELARQSQATSEPVGIVLGDLDRFKDVNDTRGHAAGDVVLREVAALLRRHLRAFDLAYRIGGEEFLILLPGSDLAHSRELAERLCTAVSANPFGGVRVTMSFGVAASEPGEGFEYSNVFAAADMELYRAKEAGRNRVSSAEQHRALLATTG